MSIVPFGAWDGFDSQIRWLARRDEPTFPTWLQRLGGVSGGVLSTRLGRTNVKLSHVPATGGMMQSPTIDLLGLFLFDPIPESRVLLGLHGGIADIGRLVVEPGCAGAHFEI